MRSKLKKCQGFLYWEQFCGMLLRHKGGYYKSRCFECKNVRMHRKAKPYQVCGRKLNN